MQSVQDYLAAWNAQTAEERLSLLQSCMTEQVVYLDPHAPDPIQGIEGMQALIEHFRSRFNHKLEPEGQIDRHHSVFRLRWRLQKDSGEIFSQGLMVGDLTDAGLIERMVHFVDPANPT